MKWSKTTKKPSACTVWQPTPARVSGEDGATGEMLRVSGESG